MRNYFNSQLPNSLWTTTAAWNAAATIHTWPVPTQYAKSGSDDAESNATSISTPTNASHARHDGLRVPRCSRENWHRHHRGSTRRVWKADACERPSSRCSTAGYGFTLVQTPFADPRGSTSIARLAPAIATSQLSGYAAKPVTTG